MFAQGYSLRAIEYVPDSDNPDKYRDGDAFTVVGWVYVEGSLGQDGQARFRPVLIAPGLVDGGQAFVADPNKVYEFTDL
jgi:hypothetical protein